MIVRLYGKRTIVAVGPEEKCNRLTIDAAISQSSAPGLRKTLIRMKSLAATARIARLVMAQKTANIRGPLVWWAYSGDTAAIASYPASRALVGHG